jgi:hypothetical protein
MWSGLALIFRNKGNNMYLQSSPKVLQMRIFTGKDSSPLFYSYDNEPTVYSIPDRQQIPRPSFLEHLPDRETSPSDIPDLMLHGLMDEDSFKHLDGVGLIDPILKEMYTKIQDLNKKLADLETMTDPQGNLHDSHEMQMGIQTEMEHTDNPAVSAEVADDHLDEIPDYYSRLKEMEAEGKASAGEISEALMSVLNAVKGLGEGASGTDAMRAIFDTVKGECADRKNILKFVSAALGR